MSVAFERWSKVIARTTVGGQMPVEFRLNRIGRSGFNDPELDVVLAVPERDDPAARTFVIFSLQLPYNWQNYGEHEIAAHLRYRLHDAYKHEADEWLKIGDVRPFDPHRPIDDRVDYTSNDLERMEQTLDLARRDR